MNEWISVKDKLPSKEENVRVLFCTTVNGERCAMWGTWEYGSFIEWDYFNDEEIDHTPNVTHWMYIPKLPND